MQRRAKSNSATSFQKHGAEKSCAGSLKHGNWICLQAIYRQWKINTKGEAILASPFVILFTAAFILTSIIWVWFIFSRLFFIRFVFRLFLWFISRRIGRLRFLRLIRHRRSGLADLNRI
ncbi:Uncharacterised protein [Mycobacteroides abscessus subsp. abscessus]|nr:Uncharacterised protein [Mycobacteroides abscessus subsp. abscessus]